MSAVRTVFGTMEIGRRIDMEESKKMFELCKKYKYFEADSAYIYGGGKTEIYLGNIKDEIDVKFKFATKANPRHGLDSVKLRKQLETSLKNLQREKVDLFYLHSPDHKTPLSETLKTVNDLYNEGKFSEFGLSNYASWQVAEIVNLCKRNSWICPTVYQGMYSALTRMVEKELIPCLRYYGLRFYAYSPLGGGFLTGKHSMGDETKQESGRFYGTAAVPVMYRDRYWKKDYFDAVNEIKASISSVYGNEVSIAEAAYRWIYHHSCLDGDKGDAVIVGASSLKQLEQNLEYTKKGPLDEAVVSVINDTWSLTSRICPNYAR